MMFQKTHSRSTLHSSKNTASCAKPLHNLRRSCSRQTCSSISAAAAMEAPSAEPLVLQQCTSVQSPLLSSAVDMQVPQGTSAEAWAAWMGQQLGSKLIGVNAKTSRAHVRTVAVQSARLIKGAIRAEELDVALGLEACHLKNTEHGPVTGSVRIVLKKEDNREVMCLSSPVWDDESKLGGSQVLDDITAAATTPLESALACHLNDMLWDIEHRSIDESMDEE